MAPPFGARMRQHRQQHQLGLADIAERTKIKASLLEALERDDLSRWPPGIYRRAYVRAYGEAIGLDGDVVAREFLEAYPEPPEVVELPPPPTGLRGLFESAIESLARTTFAKATAVRIRQADRRPEAGLPAVAVAEVGAQGTGAGFRPQPWRRWEGRSRGSRIGNRQISASMGLVRPFQRLGELRGPGLPGRWTSSRSPVCARSWAE